MRLLTLWIVVFVLALPAPAFGQATTPKDLVGTWVIPHEGKEQFADGYGGGYRRLDASLQGKLLVDMLTLNADGTYTRETKVKKGDSLITVWKWYKMSWGGGRGPYRWEVAGDTIRFRNGSVDTVQFRNTSAFPRRSSVPRDYSSTYIFQLKDRRLFLWPWMMWDAGRRDEKCAESAFERFDSSKALTLPLPPPITIKPADLVGTWAGTFENKMYGTITDSLFIGADHTLRTVHYGPVDTANEKGTWALLPGDVLTGPLGNVLWVRILLQNGELVRCNPNYAVLKRVAP